MAEGTACQASGPRPPSAAAHLARTPRVRGAARARRRPMASSFILQLPRAVPVTARRSGWTYDKEALNTPNGMTDKVLVMPGPGALKIALRPGGDVDTRLVGVLTAPRYEENCDAQGRPLPLKQQENGKLAGHAVAYYSVEERFRERQLHAALEEERPGEATTLPQILAKISDRLQSVRVMPAANPDTRAYRPPAVLLAPSGCVAWARCVVPCTPKPNACAPLGLTQRGQDDAAERADVVVAAAARGAGGRTPRAARAALRADGEPGLGAEGAPPPLGAPGAHRRARGGETWRAGLRRLAARGGTHARRNGRGGQLVVHGHMCCLRFGTPLLSLMLWQASLAYVCLPGARRAGGRAHSVRQC